MTRSEFEYELISRGFDPDIVSFDEGAKEGYGIRKVYRRWEIFFRERGNEYFVRGFPSESDALKALLQDIIGENN